MVNKLVREHHPNPNILVCHIVTMIEKSHWEISWLRVCLVNIFFHF